MTLGRTQLREKSGKTETYALTHYQPYWKHSGDYSVLRKKTVRRTRIESTVISYPIGFGQIDFRIKNLIIIAYKVICNRPMITKCSGVPG